MKLFGDDFNDMMDTRPQQFLAIQRPDPQQGPVEDQQTDFSIGLKVGKCL
jgi:hypothetical protein